MNNCGFCGSKTPLRADEQVQGRAVCELLPTVSESTRKPGGRSELIYRVWRIGSRGYGERSNAFYSSRSTINQLPAVGQSFPGLLGYRRDRRVTRIWRDCFGGRGNRENPVLHFPLHHGPRFAWQNGFGTHERVPDLPFTLVYPPSA